MMSGRRLVAASIDLVVVGIFTLALSVILETRVVLSFAFPSIILYRFVCHFAWGQTIGKHLLAIRVDTGQYVRSTLRALVVRDGIYYVPRIVEDIIRLAIAYSAAWAWAILLLTLIVDIAHMVRSSGSASLHDNLARTVVVAVASHRRVTEHVS